ncbi:MBL fold metallo-hydrolase [Brevibacillus ruminantium]|uniref:MBL fold metallo-hydrolase n=1 Tax=Brevibacillus ruminantium TaxID=2950604 RepID=A0ABY4WIZ5_9BACL|nr:MBL fold metallo-hydrolase [Brevibacillus ruminantium]USG67023.1 MBL fold metallo-hydrolase [Brevibacillus ruminantium]
MRQMTVWGGAGEHGRSSYVIQKDDTRILLDCGGKKEAGGVYPLLVPHEVAQLDAVFLSHAHEDHSMAIPLLYKFGYEGVVWTTKATADQLPGYYAAWRRYAARHSAEPPYREEDIRAVRFAYLDEAVMAGEWLSISPSLRICWGRTGHMLGSVWMLLAIEGSSVFFSGDFTGESELLRFDWPGDNLHIWEQEPIGLSIVDAAYGMDDQSQADKLAELSQQITTAIERGGKVLLPVPVRGRSQDLLVWASETFPQVRLLVESDIRDGLEQLLERTDWLHPGADERIRLALNAPNMRVIRSSAEREKELAQAKSCIILTGDGMMESERAGWYYEQLRGQTQNTIILTGHLAAESLGRQLLEKAVPSDHACDVRFIRYKVHQGAGDVRKMLQAVPSRQTLLVHAGKPATDRLAEALFREGFRGLNSLSPGESLSFE